jgi:DNA helicase-2/ATP-dependent DNA helicase PcrA
VTFHAAKGLEWPTVHVAGLEAGLVPIAHARTAAAEAEERRLLYVAVTRAQRELHCSWAQARQVGRERVERAPSPYLAAITAAIESLTAAREPGDWRAHIAAERALLAGDGSRSALAPLVQALREWRTAAARAADVPASVIMSDQSIEAVAAAQPGDEDALRALPGIEPLKVARFAEAVLDVVARHRPAS